MADHASFLKAILADPDDDSLRLIFADWLEEHGDPLGEFIRTQYALLESDLDPATSWKLLQRERELKSEHGVAWAGPIAALAMSYDFRKGFVEEIGIDAKHFVEQAASLFDAAPIRRLTPCNTTLYLTEFLQCPQLERLAALSFIGTDLGDDGAMLIAQSPYLCGLRELYLETNLIELPGARALAEAPALAPLTELHLEGNPIGDLGAEAIVNAVQPRQLTKLGLVACDIGETGGKLIGGSPRLAQIRCLNLGSNPLGNTGLRSLLASRYLGGLRVLVLHDTGINALGAQALARCAGLKNLRQLDLSRNPVSNLGAEALAQSPHLADLEGLSLRETHVGNTGALALAASAFLQKLKWLILPTLSDEPTRQRLRERFGGRVTFA